MPWRYKPRVPWYRNLPSPSAIEVALLVVSLLLVIVIAVRLALR
jgi:hypothetical protein